MSGCDCGLFKVSSTFMDEPGTNNNCVVVLVLTVGGTGIPLLIIIVSLLCILCCMCRRRNRNKSFDVTSKTIEANGDSKSAVETGGVQMKELEYAAAEDMGGPLYDEVQRIEKVEITISDVKSPPDNVPEDMMPQPYEEFASVVKKPAPPPQLPEYATPERTLSKSDSDSKPAPELPQGDQYSSLFEDEKKSSARNSMSLLPEGMYSSIGDIIAPPLPPPLATENIPIEIRISLDNLAEKEGKADEGGGGGQDAELPDDPNEQILADAIEEMEKFANLDVTDGNAPFYTNVTHQQRSVHSSREKLDTDKSEVAYYNTREKLFSTQQDEVEIKQDLYVNF